MPAQPTSTVRLTADDDELRFEVTDDGAGFDIATARKGAGLTNMGDRLDAIGGALVISSKLGAGTTISGSVRVPSRVMVGV